METNKAIYIFLILVALLFALSLYGCLSGAWD